MANSAFIVANTAFLKTRSELVFQDIFAVVASAPYPVTLSASQEIFTSWSAILYLGEFKNAKFKL